jgi:hypothetical protein
MSVALSVCSTDLIRAIDKGASLALIRLVGEAGDTTVHRVSLPGRLLHPALGVTY